MNNERRKRIRALVEKLGPAASVIDEVRAELEDVKAEEEDYLENMPESFQNGEKGEHSNAAILAMEEALETLGDLSFDDLTGHLETACD